MTVTVSDEKDDDAYKLKDFMRKQGAKFIKEQLGTYISDLRQGKAPKTQSHINVSRFIVELRL